MDETHETLDSTLESVDKAEELALRKAETLGVDEDELVHFGMAVRECMVNAVVHGNRYSQDKKVHLDIQRSQDRIIVTIRDEGSGFDPESLPDPLAPENLMRQSGRGLLLTRTFVDEFSLNSRPGAGTEVRLVKNRARA
ncbi:MAG: ATP-binding protein [Bryobacteraceae bacterium]